MSNPLGRARWKKSSYSQAENDCVEVGVRDTRKWKKSSYSKADNDCVEVGADDHVIGVRDTKDRAAGHLTVSSTGWTSLLDTLRH